MSRKKERRASPTGKIRFDGPVVVLRSTATVEAGIAGALGTCVGFSEPSSSGVAPVIGGAPKDVALAIDLGEGRSPIWVNPDLLVAVVYR